MKKILSIAIFLKHNTFITIFMLLQKSDSLKRLLENVVLAENRIEYITLC